jgi:hypothetical protein
LHTWNLESKQSRLTSLDKNPPVLEGALIEKDFLPKYTLSSKNYADIWKDL